MALLALLQLLRLQLQLQLLLRGAALQLRRSGCGSSARGRALGSSSALPVPQNPLSHCRWAVDEAHLTQLEGRVDGATLPQGAAENGLGGAASG